MSNSPIFKDLEKSIAEEAAAESALMKPILAQIRIGKASAYPAVRRAALRLEKRLLAPAKRKSA